MKQLLHSNLLVTLAEKQGSPAMIKVWDLNKIVQLEDAVSESDEKMKTKFITQVYVHDGDNSYPISCFLFNEFLTCIALGYTNGKVILVRGDLLRDRGSKQRVVYESVDPITGVHFNRSEEILYVTTTSRILTVLTTGRNQGKPLRILSANLGADLDCSDLEYRTSKLITANTEGFRYFNHASKAHVVNFNVPKRKILRLFKDYLLAVCPVEESSAPSSRNFLTRLLVLDMNNMHISFSLTIPNLSISHVFTSNTDSEAYLLSTDGILYKLHEKPINQQVEIIIQRDLYSIALNLANQYSLSKATKMRINKLHGDYLYEKQDFDAAIEKYIDCLPLFETENEVANAESEKIDDLVINVITNFKEVSNIHNMTKFLSSLYKLKLADNDHLTLLLCCYCKLKMTEELDTFIEELDLDTEGEEKSSGKLDLSKLNFSLIINLFKECGYYPQVTKLLYKLNLPQLIVRIQLNDLHQHQNCMSYIKTLPIDELLRILIDFLKDLLDCMPLETTELLINVFTGKYKPEESHTLFSVPEKRLESPDVNSLPKPEVSVSSYVAFLGYLAGPLRLGENAPEELPEETEPTYLPPRPSLVFSCFINHPKEFIVFLEACKETFDKFQGNVNDKKELLLTLFEMYLSMAKDEPSNEEEWRSKAKELMLEHLNLLDKSSALLISHIYGFVEGEKLAQEASEDFEEGFFRTAQMTGDFSGAFDVVRKYGERKPMLYKLMLNFIVSSKNTFQQATQKDFRFLLENIRKHKLATPVDIVKILSSNELALIGVVKDFLIEHIGQTEREITNNAKLIQSYEEESTKFSQQLAELTSNPVILQNNKCSNCELKLEFPLVHFKCKHSYHQRCLNENTYIPDSSTADEPKCPLCINEMQSAQALRDNQLHASDNYDVFEMRLNQADDRFKVICEYLGRGVMELE